MAHSGLVLDTHMRTVRYLRPESISAYFPLREGSPAAGYHDELLAEMPFNLTGYWPLDDFSGTIAADHGTNNLNGLATNVDFEHAGIGDERTAAYFNGTSSTISLTAGDVDAVFDGDEGTFSLWMKVPTSVLADAAIHAAVLFYVDANNSLYIYKTATNNQFTVTYEAGGTVKFVNVIISDDQWHHVAVTWSASADELKVYLDGSQTGTTQTGLGTWAGTFTSCAIGSNGFGASWWSGRLAHLAMWDTPLSGTSIANLYVADSRVLYDYGPAGSHGDFGNLRESAVQALDYGPGGTERAYWLAGAQQYMSFPVSALSMDPRHWTISFFAKADTFAEWQDANRRQLLYANFTDSGGTFEVYLELATTGDLRLFVDDGLMTYTDIDLSGLADDWVHIAVSYSLHDDTTYVHINGVQEGFISGTSRSIGAGALDTLYLGSWDTLIPTLPALYSDMVLYSAALEADEIAVLSTIQAATTVDDLADNENVKGDVWKVRIVDKATNIIVAELNPENTSVTRKLSEAGEYSYTVPIFMPDATQIESYTRSYLLLNGVTIMDGDITKVKYELGNNGLMYNVGGLGELADLSNTRAKSTAQYQDNTVIAILNDLLARTPGWALGDTTTMLDVGVTTTVDLRDEERLFSQIVKAIESVPDLYFRYGGLDSLGNRLIDIGYFDDESNVAVEQVDDAELSARQGKLGWGGIRQISKDEDRSNILYQIEAYGGVYEDANEVDQTIDMLDALAYDPTLAVDPDYPIVNTGEGYVVRSVANYAGGVGAEVTRHYDEHVPDTEEVPTLAEIADAGYAAYQHAVKDLKEASGAEVTYSLDVIGFTLSNRWAKNPFYTVPASTNIAWNGDFADLTPLGTDYAGRVDAPEAEMIAYWPFNGDYLDYSGYGYDGSAVGAPGTTATTWGDDGTAPDLNGSSQYIDISSASGAVDPNDFSLSMWFRNDDTYPVSSNRMLFEVYIDANYWVRAYFHTSGNFIMEVRVGGVNVTSYFAPYLYPGTWHHVAFVTKASEFYMIVDGRQKSTPTGKGTVLGVPTSTHLGATQSPSLYFNGPIADVSLYDGSLTDDEIVDLQRRPLGNVSTVGVGYATVSNNGRIVSTGANAEGYQDTDQEVYNGDQITFSVNITNNLATDTNFDLVLYDATGLSSETISDSFTITASAGPNPYSVSGTATEHWGELRAAVRITDAAARDLTIDDIAILYYHELWGSPGVWRVEKGSIPLVGQKVQVVANQIGVLLDPATGVLEVVQGLAVNRKLRMDNIKITGARNRATTYALAMSTSSRLMSTDPVIQLFDSIRQLPRKRSGAAANLASDAVASNTGSASAVSPDTTLSDGTPAKLITVALPVVPGWATGVELAATPTSNGTHRIEISTLPALPATGLTVKVSGSNGNPWTTSDSAAITGWFLFT